MIEALLNALARADLTKVDRDRLEYVTRRLISAAVKRGIDVKLLLDQHLGDLNEQKNSTRMAVR